MGIGKSGSGGGAEKRQVFSYQNVQSCGQGSQRWCSLVGSDAVQSVGSSGARYYVNSDKILKKLSMFITSVVGVTGRKPVFIKINDVATALTFDVGEAETGMHSIEVDVPISAGQYFDIHVEITSGIGITWESIETEYVPA